MADPILVGEIDTNDFVNIDRIDELIAKFGPGERGQITLPLDPEIAVGEQYTHFLNGTRHLNSELKTQGLLPWPGQRDIAILDWPNHNVYIRFMNARAEGIPAVPLGPGHASQRAYQSLTTQAERERWMHEQIAQSADEDLDYARYIRTPSMYIGLLGRFVSGTGMRVSTNQGFRRLAAQTGRKLVAAGGAFSGRLAALKSARLSFKTAIASSRFAGRAAMALPSLLFLVAAGAIIFFALNPDKLIQVLKWAAEKVVEGIKQVGEKAADAFKGAVGENMGMLVLAGGLIAGGYLFMRRKR